MTPYTLINIDDVEDTAVRFGLSPSLEARFGGRPLGSKVVGVSRETLAPGFRVPFGHTHRDQEEVYVVLRGSARVKVDDEIVELGELDAIRFDKGTMRAVEAGPDGVEYVAFGAGDDPRDAELVQGWWSD